jgi:decaprenylphospho-beta-D-erythro-pentofuranosid-2-ulose 2-reductase
MNILILGATSAMAQATAKRMGNAEDQFFLVARNATHLKTIADDLHVRTQATVHTFIMDTNDTDKHEVCISHAKQKMGQLDVILVAHGTLSHQNKCEQSIDCLRKEFETNAFSTVAFLTLIANELEAQKYGQIAVITSVAGDRGRQSNYVYGAAKAMVNTFLQGLRHRLATSNVHVLCVKPGLTDTPMTKAITPKGLLWATPETIAKDITRGIYKKKNVIYTPWFWWGIMLIIRNLPTWLLHKTNL